MNFFRRALVLLDSVANTTPDIKTVVIIVDMVDAETLVKIKKLQKRHSVIFADALTIEKYNEMCFKYDLVELNTAIKPAVFNYLFREGAQKAIYLDPDILVVENLNTVFTLLDNYSAIITPHLISDGFSQPAVEKYAELRLCGIMNLGFIAVSNDNHGRRLISWWEKNLLNTAFVDKFLFTAYDQKWADAFSSLFGERIFVERNPGFNVASWNIHERELVMIDKGFSIAYKEKKHALVFFHFSGYKIGSNVLNWRFPEFKIIENTPLHEITSKYNSLIENIPEPDLDKAPYAFSRFSNNSLILPIHRRFYRQMAAEIDGDPFDANGPFYKSLAASRVLGNANYVEDIRIYTKTQSKKNNESLFKFLLILFFRLFGLKKYLMLLEAFYKYSRMEHNTFLIDRQFKKYFKKNKQEIAIFF
jgi:hypothetical protein